MSLPGPGRKRRRSLAGGLIWVLLGLVWLGSPIIVRMCECRTDSTKASSEITFDWGPITKPSIEHGYRTNSVQSDDTLKSSQRKSNQMKQTQQDSLINKHHNHHHHHLHHPVQLIDSNDLKAGSSFMVNGNEVIQKKSKAACPNCAIGLSSEADTQAKSNKIRTRSQSNKSKFKMPAATFRPINTDSLRLEAIKQQILSKLGLKSKPNITHEFSKQTILNTLSRADDTNLQNDDYEPNTRNYYDYFKLIDRHSFDSNSINTNDNNNNNNHYDFVTSNNHITNNMNATYRDSTFTNNHIIPDKDRINIDHNDNHYNKNLMDSTSNTNYINANYIPQHHITHKHPTSYHPSKSKNHACPKTDKHKPNDSTKIPLNHSAHKSSISNNRHKLKVHRNRTTINGPKDFYKIDNFSDISDHSDNNLLFVNEDDSYHIDGQFLQRHAFHQQPEQLNEPPDNFDGEQDDYFGRTREVITFAEQGKS